MTAALAVLPERGEFPPDPAPVTVYLLTRVTRSQTLNRQEQYPAGVYLSKGDAMASAERDAARLVMPGPLLSWVPVSDRAWESGAVPQDRFALVYEIRRFDLGAEPVSPEDELPLFPGHVVPHEDGDCTCQ